MFDIFYLYQIVFLFFAYLIGSIPTGYLFAKFFFGIDITHKGSGNIGASNVARVLGARYFILIFLIDAGKAFLTLYLAYHAVSQEQMFILACALMLLLGNAYSLFLQFRGGKGVATVVGIIAFLLSPVWFSVFIGVWLAVLIMFKEAFIASLSAALYITFGYFFSYGLTDTFYFFVFLCIWLVSRHQQNIYLFFSKKDNRNKKIK